MKHSIPEHSIRGDKYDYMCAAAYIYLNPISESYSTCSPTPHLEVGVYSKKKVAFIVKIYLNGVKTYSHDI